jgi:adenosylcobinamide-GDP ribazoletransferase
MSDAASDPVTSPRSVRAAFVFLTRIPLGGFPFTEAEWRAAAAHFPLVGAAVGAVAAGVDGLLLPLGPVVAALAAIASTLLLTGAFHEDGLADTSDALGGAFDREKILVILKDSRVGTFGACALVLSIVGRAALLVQLTRTGDEVLWALPLVGAAARVGPIWQIATMPYVTSSDRARSSAIMGAGATQAYVGSAWLTVLASALVAGHQVSVARVAALVAGCAATTALCSWRYYRRLGGITGDFLGATEQLCEIVALAALAWGR